MVSYSPEQTSSIYEKLYSNSSCFKNYFEPCNGNSEFVTIEDPLVNFTSKNKWQETSREVPFEVWANNATKNGNKLKNLIRELIKDLIRDIFKYPISFFLPC